MYAIGMICLTTCTSFLLKIAGLRKNKKKKKKKTHLKHHSSALTGEAELDFHEININCFRVQGPLIDGFVLQSSVPSHHKKVKKKINIKKKKPADNIYAIGYENTIYEVECSVK